MDTEPKFTELNHRFSYVYGEAGLSFKFGDSIKKQVRRHHNKKVYHEKLVHFKGADWNWSSGLMLL